MANILTVTFNPTIDKSTTIPALIPEKKLRCTAPVFEPGGGGLNVARAIKKLGGEAIALFPAGGYSGKFLEKLIEDEGVSSNVVETKNHTRENLIVLDKSTNQQYRFGMPGSEVYPEEWEEILDIIKTSEAEYIVASGSLPPGIPEDIYGRIGEIAKRTKARLIVDTSGDALKEAVRSGVYLLKPNLGELATLSGKEELREDEVNEMARKIIDQGGAEILIVSMGAAGARLITREEIYQATPPVLRRLSTVGAGDSMVAGVVLSLSKGKGLKEALQYGVAAGTAATLNPGTELCKLEDVQRIFKWITGT